MLQVEFNIKKSRIARSFSQAAKSYDSHASLQRKVANKLLGQLGKNENVQRVLDLGSGTGYCTSELHRLYPNAEIINLDIAEAMLLFAEMGHKNIKFKVKSVCADAEALPFSSASFDVIFSSLSIQWCQNYSVLFSELKRVLMSHGNLFLSTFGPGTLQEVTQAWKQIDSFIHVNRFQADTLLKHELINNGFTVTSINSEKILTYYKSFEELARELKLIGARNMNAGQGQGLNGREKILKLKEVFELNSNQQLGIPVTYQVYYLGAQE